MSSIEKSKKAEVIFLIGAGVSVPIGIPAMHGIYKSFLNKSKSRITSEEKRLCQFFTRELGVKEDLEEFLLAANTIVEFESSSLYTLLEKVVSQREGSRRTDYNKRLKKKINKVKAIRNRILDFMSRTCFQFDRKKVCEIFCEFIKAVSKQGFPIYTTNYDHALEYVAIEKEINIEDNFIKQGQRQLWNPKIHFSLGGALTIIKLHGSVTWYIDDDRTIEKINSNTDINLIGKNINRILIFPTRFKDIYDQHFFALYSHFLSSLSDARILFILGHSLRDNYLRAGIIERFRKGDFKLVIVDPVFPNVLPNEMKPKGLGKAGDITHIPYKFEEFSDEIANIIINFKASEIPEKCAAIVHHRRIKSNKIKIKGKIGSLKPGITKKFTAVIDAYLLPNEKPAYVRIWLSANYTTPEGQKKIRVSGQFHDGGEQLICNNLTGMILDEISLKFTVPEYAEWLKYAPKITLNVAIVRKSVKKPANIGKQSILADDKRELTYKK